MNVQRNTIRTCAAIVVIVLFAQPALGRGFAGGGGFRGGGQAYTGRANSSGFDFSGDEAAQHTGYHPAGDPDHSDTVSQWNQNHPDNANEYNHNYGANYNNHNGGNSYNHNTFNNFNNSHNVAIVNPRGYGTWGWHGGVAWVPVNTYWGGGFWGAFAAGVVVAGATAAIIAASTPAYPATYLVAQSSPGYTLLTSYGLRQIPCGPGVVVVNYSGSVICAAPNATVSAGNYSVNIGSLTLVSM
jgi:hypothetical protein